MRASPSPIDPVLSAVPKSVTPPSEQQNCPISSPSPSPAPEAKSDSHLTTPGLDEPEKLSAFHVEVRSVADAYRKCPWLARSTVRMWMFLSIGFELISFYSFWRVLVFSYFSIVFAQVWVGSSAQHVKLIESYYRLWVVDRQEEYACLSALHSGY